MGKCATIGVGLTDLLFITAIAVCGGVFNHMRGSGGGTLPADAFSKTCDASVPNYECGGYWVSHIYTRLLFAVPTGALIQLLTRNPKLSLLCTFAMFISIFIGWGSYFGMGVDNNGFNSRSGFMDWILGRELEGFEWSRRWIRDFAGMGVRGLLWTLPSGYMLTWNGYHWGFAASGAMMPAIYSLANYLKNEWTADNWEPLTCTNPPFSQDWAMEKGIPMAEFLFGFWLWFCLAVGLMRRTPDTAAIKAVCTVPHKSIEFISLFFLLIFLASVGYYASVTQDDKANWGQTLVGLIGASLVLLVAMGFAFFKRRLFNAEHGGAVPAHEDEEPLLVNHSAVGDYEFEEEQEPDSPVLKYVEYSLACLSVICIIMTIVFMFTAMGWNWNTPRYCTKQDAPLCPDW
eukprot:m.359753 g.359753  ORF g.359753 m.359753 type:complete len:402 (+) comp18708_c0_seq1:330-1535(+)